MSCNSAGLPSSFDRFRKVWRIDYEFRQNKNHLPVPVAMFAKEHRTGQEVGPLTREQLLASTRLPFDTGPDVLVTSYSIVAELSCFLELGVPIPQNLICSYFETCAVINGLDIEGLKERRPKLPEACELFGIEHTSLARKEYMRDLILNNEEYTPEQWLEIADYNRDDVLDEIALSEAIAPTIDVPAALYRGRYGIAVAKMEACGIPISGRHLSAFQENWQGLRMFYIRRDDVFGLYDANGSFKEERFITLAERKGWASGWPRTATGKLSLSAKDIGQTGQALSGAEAVADPARFDRRAAAGPSAQHHRIGSSQPMRDPAVLDGYRAQSARRSRQGIPAVAAVMDSRNNCATTRLRNGAAGLESRRDRNLRWTERRPGDDRGLSGRRPSHGIRDPRRPGPRGRYQGQPWRCSQHGQADLARQPIRHVEVWGRGSSRQITGMGGNHTGPLPAFLSGVHRAATERRRPGRCLINALPASSAGRWWCTKEPRRARC
jgi:hypothetical protein